MHAMPAPSSRAARFLRPGPIMMALGALILLAGVVQTTSSTTGGGNQTCPEGTTLIAKFNYDHGYVFEKPAGNEHVVTLSHASASGANWSSTIPVVALIVKGGPGAVLYTISPAQTSGTFSNSGLPKVGDGGEHGEGNTPDISNVQFCGSNAPVPSSTTSSSTSTTSTSTSTSTSTTTTNPTPTTTCDCTTTTKHVAPTTTCECTTTTTHPTTTTTVPRESTTVADTTTSTQVSGSTLVVTSTTTHGETTTTKKAVGATTEVGQGSTTSFRPAVSSTSVIIPNDGGNLPFTGSSSWPLVGLGVILLATGLTLTLSQSRRRERSRA